MSKGTFHENLEELMELFKILKDYAKSSDGEFDISFLNDFDAILSNYNLLADDVSDEMIDQVGTPLKDMVGLMVDQLRDEVDRINVIPKQSLVDVLKTELNQINEMLGKSDPLSRNVDDLLDRRTEIVKDIRKLKDKSS